MIRRAVSAGYRQAVRDEALPLLKPRAAARLVRRAILAELEGLPARGEWRQALLKRWRRLWAILTTR